MDLRGYLRGVRRAKNKYIPRMFPKLLLLSLLALAAFSMKLVPNHENLNNPISDFSDAIPFSTWSSILTHLSQIRTHSKVDMVGCR